MLTFKHWTFFADGVKGSYYIISGYNKLPDVSLTASSTMPPIISAVLIYSLYTYINTRLVLDTYDSSKNYQAVFDNG